MPDLKISQMAPALQALAADLFPIVQGLTNYKQTRQMFLSAVVGEAIYLQSVNSAVGLDAADNAVVNVGNAQSMLINLTPGGGTFQVNTPASSLVVSDDDFEFGASGITVVFSAVSGLDIECVAGLPWTLGTAGASIIGYDGVLFTSWIASSGVDLLIKTDAATFQMFASGNIAFALPPGIPITIPYQTVNVADWSHGAPGTYEDALNRIAACLAILNGGPIP